MVWASQGCYIKHLYKQHAMKTLGGNTLVRGFDIMEFVPYCSIANCPLKKKLFIYVLIDFFLIYFLSLLKWFTKELKIQVWVESLISSENENI